MNSKENSKRKVWLESSCRRCEEEVVCISLNKQLYAVPDTRLWKRLIISETCIWLLCGLLKIFCLDFSKYQFNAQFFYSSTICMLHYAPQHVSSSTLLILRRTNFITTASGIVTLCKQPYRTAVRSPPAYGTAAYRGWRYQRLWWYNWSSWGREACCSKHVEERSVTYILLKNKRIVPLSWYFKKSILWCTVRKTSKYSASLTLMSENMNQARFSTKPHV